MGQAGDRQAFHQHLDALSLARAAGAQNHDSMPHL